MASETQEFQFDMGKFKELVLYICSVSRRDRLGAVKLNKALYYSDMLFYVEEGRPITGATYRRRPMGPTADPLLRALYELERDGSIRVEEVPYFGFRKKEFHPQREPDVGRFNSGELAFAKEVIRFVCEDHTAKEISELSHNPAWEATLSGDVIPYYSAFLMYQTQVSEDSMEASERAAHEIETERRDKGTVDYPTFGSLRDRLQEEQSPSY
jgi:hypothetical protein